MERDNAGNYYKDHMCFWRCLAAGLGKDPHDLEPVLCYYDTYKRCVNAPHWKQFSGVLGKQMSTMN